MPGRADLTSANLASATDARTTRLCRPLQRRSSARRLIAHGNPYGPALQLPLARATLPRPPHPAPNVRDDRETPLFRDGMSMDIDLIWVRRETKYFSNQGWTIDLPEARLICPTGSLCAQTQPPCSVIYLHPQAATIDCIAASDPARTARRAAPRVLRCLQNLREDLQQPYERNAPQASAKPWNPDDIKRRIGEAAPEEQLGTERRHSVGLACNLRH